MAAAVEAVAAVLVVWWKRPQRSMLHRIIRSSLAAAVLVSRVTAAQRPLKATARLFLARPPREVDAAETTTAVLVVLAAQAAVVVAVALVPLVLAQQAKEATAVETLVAEHLVVAVVVKVLWV